MFVLDSETGKQWIFKGGGGGNSPSWWSGSEFISSYLFFLPSFTQRPELQTSVCPKFEVMGLEKRELQKLREKDDKKHILI